MDLVNINWKPEKKELVDFGTAMGIGFPIIALIVWWLFSAPNVAIGLAAFGIVLFLLSRIYTPLVLPVYYPWMAVAMVMGTIISYLIVAFIYFIMITPLALFFKIRGRDSLDRSLDSDAESYWSEVDNQPDNKIEEYERQF
ncbi:MAG: hypothetical protein AAF391_12415 [Bacteroidota bacterium]